MKENKAAMLLHLKQARPLQSHESIEGLIVHVFISFLSVSKQLVKQCIITKRMKSMPAQIVKFFSQLAMANSNSLFPYLPHPLIDCPWQLSVSTDR